MATALRRILTDFQAAIAARGVNAGTSQNLYSSSLNADNTTISVTKNGVVLFAKVLWQNGIPVSTITDAGGPNEDTVIIYGADGNVGTGSAQQFLQSLV